MRDFSRDEDFRREWDYLYLRSVHAAASAAFERAVWKSEDEAYVALATELRNRGIEPEPDALLAGAALISRGEKPAILRPAVGRRRREVMPRRPAAPTARDQLSNSFAGHNGR
ncbi:MAG: hypothetical protein GEU93_02800 [Propionibacteriales bacterium]|nr:hypothetical protein [Propionibacteriales bacterium]